MNKKEILIKALREELNNLDLENLQDFKKLIDEIHALPEEDLKQIYQYIGGLSEATKIGKDAIVNLPYPVAILLRETNRQRNDLVRLLFLMETIECLVRWRMGQVLSIIHEERDWNIPDHLFGDLSKSILKPSMGIWIGGFERIAKQVQKNKTAWGVEITELLTDIDLLNSIVQIRNSIAHGDIMGDAEAYLEDTQKYAEEFFERYAALKIKHYIVFNDVTYQADGYKIKQQQENITLSVPEEKRLDNGANYYCFTVENQPILQHPCIFRIFEDTPTIDALTHTFSTGSFISTHKDCRSVSAGGSLVYSLVDGKTTPHISDLKDFVFLFKTDKKVMSNEPWRGLFEELGPSSAWKIDRKLIKHCRQKYVCLANTKPQSKIYDVEKPKEEEFPPALMWYFGGGPEIGKSTILLSYLENTSSGGTFVFPYRFQKPQENVSASLDEFLRALRNAVVYWLRRYTDVSMPDENLLGDDLFKDLDSLLERLCSEHQSTELIIGLDDLHHLYEHETEQHTLSTLLGYVQQWGRFTHTKVQTGFDNKEKKQTFDNQYRRQIFVIATGLDQGDENQDIDNFLANDERAAFIYHQTNIESFYPKAQLQETTKKNTTKEKTGKKKAKKEKGKRKELHERQKEMHEHTCVPSGSHMPKIQKYGVIEIMRENKRNPRFGNFMKKDPDGPGHQFIADILEIARGRPLIIDAVADNLHSGDIDITDPITERSFTVTHRQKGSPYLENTSYIIPTILCFMKTLGVPLTISSLQLLCSNDIKPDPTQNTWISQALYTIPQYIEKVSLTESNSDGTLAIGWQLRSTNPPDMFKKLGMVQSFVDVRIRGLTEKQNINKMSDSLPIKGILQQYAGISPKNNGNAVQDIFVSLRGALTPGIRQTLDNFSQQYILKSSADMLYQTSSIAPASITWLQKASESDTLQKDADNYTNSPSFNDLWLKHINAECTPIFEHQVSSIGYSEKLECTIPINSKFYIAIGLADKKTGVHNSIAVYQQYRTQPDIVLLALDSPQKATDCTVSTVNFDGKDKACIAIAIGQEVHLHMIILDEQATSNPNPHIHQYKDSITGLLRLDDNLSGVYGERIDQKEDKKGLAIDILGDLFTNVKLHTRIVDGTAKKQKPKFAFHAGSQSYISYSKDIVEVNVNNVSNRFPIGSVPKESPYAFSNGFLCQAHTKKSATKNTWYSVTHQKSILLQNEKGEDKFHKINFVHAMEGDRLLTVDYVGVLRIYEWPSSEELLSKNFKGRMPICELNLNVPEEITSSRIGVIGGLLHGTKLLLYGVRSFMTFYDIANIIKNPGKSTTINQQIDLSLHFGSVSGAMPIEVQLGGYDDLFVTWSDDNDSRLWSWSSGSFDNPDDFCLGLFRGHSEKLKGLHVANNTLVSIDIKQNIRTWYINEGCIKQRNTLPNHTPKPIQYSFLNNNKLWSITTNSGNSQIESYPSHPKSGFDWSSHRAYNAQQAQQKHIAQDIERVFHLGQYIILLPKQYRKSDVQIFDTQTNGFITLPTLKNLVFTKAMLYANGILLYNSTDIYRLCATPQPTLSKIPIQLQDNEVISVARANSNGIQYVTTDTNSNDYHLHIADPKGKNIQKLTTIQSSAAIDGIYCNGDIYLFWISREGQALELYWYDKNLNQCLKVPKHNLLLRKLHTIYCLPNSTGFSFKSGDNDRRWTLRFDYPVIDDSSQHIGKELILDVYTDWEYASFHLDEMIKNFHDRIFTLDGVMAEISPVGVIVHYQHKEGPRRLLWTGYSITSFKLTAITKEGLVVLTKNRKVIILQLMKGAHPIGFNDNQLQLATKETEKYNHV